MIKKIALWPPPHKYPRRALDFEGAWSLLKVCNLPFVLWELVQVFVSSFQGYLMFLALLWFPVPERLLT